VKVDESTRAQPNAAHKEIYTRLLSRQSDLTRRIHAAGYL
jgi:xylulokinase